MGDPSGEDEAVWARQEALESGTWANCSHGRGVPADSWAQEDSRLPNNCFFNGCCFHLRHFFPWSSNFFHRLGITGNQLHEVPSFRSCCHIFFRHIFLRGSFFLALYATLRGRRGTWNHQPSFRVVGVALGDTTVVSRGRRGTWRHPPSFRVAGVTFGDILRRFAWQAWHLATSTIISRGRRGTWRQPPSFRVAGVALGEIHHRFAWQAWHLATSTIISRGRRGTWRQPPSFRVAGVALGEIHHRFAWQAWHLATSSVVSRGRRVTWRHPPSFRVAGVALGDIHHRFTWQAWHFWNWAGSWLHCHTLAGSKSTSCHQPTPWPCTRSRPSAPAFAADADSWVDAWHAIHISARAIGCGENQRD